MIAYLEIAPAFPIMVTYSSLDTSGYFKVFTDTKWDEFLKEVRAHRGFGQYGPLAYRQFFFLVPEDEPRSDDSLGRYGPVRPLTCAKDWEEATIDLRRTGQELALQIDVFRADAERVCAIFHELRRCGSPDRV